MAPVDFHAAVIERSNAVPVVVDFWAPWCAPCRVLGPLVEELASRAGGRWELVKIDTDEQPDVARAFDVRGIPAVKMFHRGEVIAEFVGALPGEEIRRWLETNLPDPDRDELDRIAGRWEKEGGSGIVGELETFVERHPDMPWGRLRLAQAVVTRDPARARELIRSVEQEAALSEAASDIASLAELMDSTAEAPPRLAPHLAGARRALAEHDLEATLEHLVGAAMIDPRFGDEIVRRAAVALFRLLGHDHQLTREYQRRLAAALHS